MADPNRAAFADAADGAARDAPPLKEGGPPDAVLGALSAPAAEVKAANGADLPAVDKGQLPPGGPAGVSWWPAAFQKIRWQPTSEQELLTAERRLLSLIKTPYELQRVDIGPGSATKGKGRWFGRDAAEPRYINTLTLRGPQGGGDAGGAASPPTIVLVHGYGAGQGFFFRNFDFLARHFKVKAIDQLGWGASSRPRYICKNTEESEAWFVESLEAWRAAQQLDSFVLLGHSFGGYVAARYALKYPERVKHLVLVGPAGFAPEADKMAEFRATWKGAVANAMWQSSATPMMLIRTIGHWGPRLVQGYTGSRFGSRAQGLCLSPTEAPLFTDYLYHSLAAPPSGEQCLRHIFSLGAFARNPLIHSAKDWKVPTTIIYGVHDWMDYMYGKAACCQMPVEAEVLRVPRGGHFVFLDNAEGLGAAVLYACRRVLPGMEGAALQEGTIRVDLESTDDAPNVEAVEAAADSQYSEATDPALSMARRFKVG